MISLTSYDITWAINIFGLAALIAFCWLLFYQVSSITPEQWKSCQRAIVGLREAIVIKLRRYTK